MAAEEGGGEGVDVGEAVLVVVVGGDAGEEEEMMTRRATLR